MENHTYIYQCMRNYFMIKLTIFFDSLRLSGQDLFIHSRSELEQTSDLFHNQHENSSFLDATITAGLDFGFVKASISGHLKQDTKTKVCNHFRIKMNEN